MISRGEGAPQPYKRQFGWRLAAGVACVALMAGCGDADVDLSMNDFLPESTPTEERAVDPEVDERIGSIASETSATMIDILRTNEVSSRDGAGGPYYVILPDERFQASLEQVGDPADFSAANLEEVRITRFYTDENGSTTDSIELSRSEGNGEWGITVVRGDSRISLTASIPQVVSGEETFDIPWAEGQIEDMLSRMEHAAQITAG